MNELLLSVKDLSIDFRQQDGTYRRAVSDVAFDVYRGRTLGIVGESGSGKSVSCMALMHLLPTPPAHIASGSALFYRHPADSGASIPPTDLLSLNEEKIRTYRGNHISMIFQEPMTSLNPVHRCGSQVVEMLRLHEEISHDEARRRTLQLFDEVQLPRPEKIFDSYPHEISGGQKQRVMIAMSLICQPDIVIADEPTTALDVMVQKSILQLLREMQQSHNIGVIFISHDLGVIGEVADDVAVMYHGSIVEHGTAHDILLTPQHPYTRGLLACRPPLDSRPHRLPTVDDFMQQTTVDTPPATVRATLAQEPLPSSNTPSPLITLRDLHVDYALERTLLGRPKRVLHAVDGIDLDIMEGETIGLVGGSGCGKTTLGRALLRLIDHQSGTIAYRGQPLDTLPSSAMRHMRQRLQIIFQDPYSSLNPHMTIGEAIAEPLRVHHPEMKASERQERVTALMQQVGLQADHYQRYPHEFSGGQRQRACIARALIIEPELVVCDESVSALDVSVQAQVLNLLSDLKQQYHYTYLFITHDLAVVNFIADRIIVMQNGHFVESGTPDEIFSNPQHPYTRQLIEAIPRVGEA